MLRQWRRTWTCHRNYHFSLLSAMIAAKWLIAYTWWNIWRIAVEKGSCEVVLFSKKSVFTISPSEFRRQVLRPHGLPSGNTSTHGTPTASGSSGQTALASSTYGSTSRIRSRSTSSTQSDLTFTTSASASYPWQSGDSNVALDQCGLCGKRIADYISLVEHIDSCNSSSRYCAIFSIQSVLFFSLLI